MSKYHVIVEFDDKNVPSLAVARAVVAHRLAGMPYAFGVFSLPEDDKSKKFFEHACVKKKDAPESLMAHLNESECDEEGEGQ